MLKILPMEKLVNNFNVRNEDDETLKNLIDSIKANGLITPISVREIDNGKYQIVAGHRRYKAMQRLGEPMIECNILDNIEKDVDLIRAQLAENIQRKNMTCLEYVEMFEKLKAEYNISNSRLALYLNKSLGWIQQQYAAAKLLNDKYGDKTKIPAKVLKKSAASIRKDHYENTTDKKTISGKGFTCIIKGHRYQILCTDFEFEQKLLDLLKEHRDDKSQSTGSRWIFDNYAKE